MRKFYSLVLSALVAIPMAMNAQMTEENEVLANLEDGYRLEKDVDFKAATVNGVAIQPAYSLQFGAEVSGVKINGYVPKFLTNTGLEFMSFNLPGDNIDWPNNNALRSTKNERWIGIHYLREGQIVVFDVSNKDAAQFVPNSIACNKNTGWADTPQEPQILEEISQEIHDLQDLSAERDPETGEIISSNADAFRYFRVINSGDCYIKFNGKTANYLSHFQIWSPAGEAEVVSAPSLKVTGVNYDSRTLEFKPGESTFGNPVVTYYSTDGSDPVFLKDSEEVDHYEDDIPVYKKVLDMDAVADAGGLFGENEPYDPEMGYIAVDANFDEDDGIQDNIVTVKAVSVSVETGVISDIITLPVSVEEITLNEPTFTLAGIDGVDRTYTIGWTNNTLCGEDYQMIVETGEGGYYELDPNTGIGSTVTSAKSVKVTVQVEGYNDGSDELSVDYAGIDITRKNTPEEGETTHDWDFTALTNYQLALIKQDYSLDENIIESCYVVDDPLAENPQKEYYTKEEFINGESDGGVDLSEATPVLKASGWTFDSGNYRATLNVASSEEVDPETLHDFNDNGYGYMEDQAGIFDGLQISCPPNTKNNSCVLIYMGKTVDAYNNDGITQLGAYFMSKPTITFPREVAKAGELVIIYYGTGGSNYTNYRAPMLATVPEDALLTVTLPNGSHVFYIDVYTYDSLPEDTYVTGIDAAKTTASAQIAAYYTFGGVRIAAPQKGFNMVKYTDGSIKKLFVK